MNFKLNSFYKNEFNPDLMIQIKRVMTQQETYSKVLADWWSCKEVPATSTGITQEVIINKEDEKFWREV